MPVSLEKDVPPLQDLSEPLEDLRRVDDLVLDELLGHGEEHLGVDIPEGQDDVLGVPHLDLVRLVEDQQGLEHTQWVTV